ncbi:MULTISPECIES: I78 family peptidase inhibitor [unclassified Acinetobacter]|uniref:I78 family peptidase inhibitor n=1 Tax=unclassified Acinetobacter TaxID=196816 RepID=UPI00257517DC|nr:MULTISPECIES: I78 family peptidase inhibitor [unclassified Acinetobacter]MDM1764363.1 DUF333 domain-containing protein [Acinetobacter sp. 226-1]MDM1767337.1 DUF333 domain-containing protein [Acinetobacter sp. 226-4]
MKNIVFSSVILLSLSACSTVQNQQEAAPLIGMPNPASQYCIEQGGKLEAVKDAQGESAYCHLQNGEKIEEWALFHQNQAQCVADEAKKLLGQVATDDAQLKQQTKAQSIRRVAPQQPMTMDFRSERLTLVIDPNTKKILQASCG